MGSPPGPGIPEQSPHDVQKLINHAMKRGGGGHCAQVQSSEKLGGSSGCLPQLWRRGLRGERAGAWGCHPWRSGENQEGRRSLTFEVGEDTRLGQLESRGEGLGDRSP